MSKSNFTIASPPTPTLTKEGYTLSVCAPTGGGDVAFAVADIEAAVLAAGIQSPNNAANPAQVVAVYGTTASKGRPTKDSVSGTDVIANGAANQYTDELGNPQNVLATENAGKEVCLLDEDCDLIPDETVDDTVSWNIVDGSCMIFAFDVA